MVTLRIDFARQLDRFRIYDILVGWTDGEDDGVRLGDVLEHQFANAHFNVRRLISHGNLINIMSRAYHNVVSRAFQS